MTKNGTKMTLCQKLLIMVGIVSFSAFVFPFLSLILLGVLAKLIPKSGLIAAFVTAIAFGWWGFIFGIIFGLIIWAIIIYKIKKS